MRISTAIAVVASTFLLGACGFDFGIGDGEQSDAGQNDAGDNKDDGGDKQNGAGLEINATLGLSLNDPAHLKSGEGGVSGQILIKTNGVDSKTAKVKVNGVVAPVDPLFKTANPNTVTIPDTGPGKSLRITATDGAASGSVDLPCPAELGLTSTPADGATVNVGDTIALSWTGTLNYDGKGFLKPDLQFDTYSDDRDDWDPMFDERLSLTPTDTGVNVTVPDTGGDDLLLSLRVPGDFIMEGGHSGHCTLVRRVRFEVEQSR